MAKTQEVTLSNLADVVRDSIKAGLVKIEEKKAALREKRDELSRQLQAVENDLLAIDSQLRTAAKEAFAGLGISFEPSPSVKQRAKGERGPRMATEDVEKMHRRLPEIVKAAGKSGIKAGAIKAALAADSLNPSAPTLSNTLKALVESGKIAKTGEKSQTLYHG